MPMPTLTYHRPKTLPTALALLQQPNSCLLAGGTNLTHQLKSGFFEHVIDLQAIGLDQISAQADTITLGAMVTLQAVADSPDLPNFLRQLAHDEAANTFRHIATLGGTIMARDQASELLAGLLVCEAQLTLLMDSGEQQFSLAEFLRV
ncbi:MAG TPA: hypothetical protein ENJ56_06610, partial [Anaerolineae bacterium]|nr:hypothetical protein [Anaerolineae bacterium]